MKRMLLRSVVDPSRARCVLYVLEQNCKLFHTARASVEAARQAGGWRCLKVREFTFVNNVQPSMNPALEYHFSQTRRQFFQGAGLKLGGLAVASIMGQRAFGAATMAPASKEQVQ